MTRQLQALAQVASYQTLPAFCRLQETPAAITRSLTVSSFLILRLSDFFSFCLSSSFFNCLPWMKTDVIREVFQIAETDFYGLNFLPVNNSQALKAVLILIFTAKY